MQLGTGSFCTIQLGTGSFCTIQLKAGSFRAICEGGGVTWGAFFLPGQIVATHAAGQHEKRLRPSRG